MKAIVRLAGAQVGLLQLQTVGSKIHSFGQWAATNCAALPTANAGQYATSVNRCCSDILVNGGI